MKAARTLTLDSTVTVEVPDPICGPGEVVCFPSGPDGAHQVRNDTDEPVRVLILSTMTYPAVAVYPDSGKVLFATRNPDDRALFRKADAVDYWEGEL